MLEKTANDLVLNSLSGFRSLLEVAGRHVIGAFDNRPTWDNLAPAFDNRPTWDNWNKKK
ncbi:multiple cyclophane-containing RiPP AmcA [Streptomyces sp. URMC 126]|uniref:multiple cyclophane-containing RiPP AmcA n=1 Tax=Streptomyces sp. URMC 126 TaxID=3423401 RepID=UPI003F1CF88A